ncbi:COBRA-like protein 1 [Capsicum baccatum]|uniref:COBRA-like protein 1 n=1 Tax=Capsicum baccatum TaxID=33114 RepID=A0A2G2X9E0_CAPBA|nr:COBRA-like protein 1 [Capsicum baccatum]
MTQDPGRYGASFEMGIGSASDDGSGPRIPENFTLGIPRYTCGQPFPVPPSKFSVDKGHRKTKAVATWNVICTDSEYRASSSPTCCVSLSAFYSKTIVARDSVNDGDESLNAIDIPSPWPSKKPLHPYPHKMIDSPVANKVVSGQPESAPSPNVSGTESRSPDSVLLAIGSVSGSTSPIINSDMVIPPKLKNDSPSGAKPSTFVRPVPRDPDQYASEWEENYPGHRSNAFPSIS